MVSFLQVDPLFAIDLSDPTKPKVMSELKIPGFSSYLHPWSAGLLLGLGADGTDSGATGTLKLSMFDTSDPAHVSEAATLKVAFTDAEALRNHRAVLVDESRGLLGFAASSTTTGMRYLLYRWDGSAFLPVADLPVADAAAVTVEGTSTVRGLTVDDHLYVVSGAGVDVYSTSSSLAGGLDRVRALPFDEG